MFPLYLSTVIDKMWILFFSILILTHVNRKNLLNWDFSVCTNKCIYTWMRGKKWKRIKCVCRQCHTNWKRWCYECEITTVTTWHCGHSKYCAQNEPWMDHLAQRFTVDLLHTHTLSLSPYDLTTLTNERIRIHKKESMHLILYKSKMHLHR